MQKQRNAYLENEIQLNRKFKTFKVKIYILIVATLAAFAFSLWNTERMQRASEQITEELLDQITAHKAAAVTRGIDYKAERLKNVADSLERIENIGSWEKLEGFLARKAALGEFESMRLEDAEQALTEKEVRITCKDDGKLEYEIPVYAKEGNVYVLRGLSSGQEVNGYERKERTVKQNATCIVDKYGKEVLRINVPKQHKNMYETFFQDDASQRNPKIQEKNGIFKVHADKEIYASYDDLKVNGWYLLTLIPGDLITGISKRYMDGMNLAIAVLAASFVIFCFMFFRTYYNGKKELFAKIYYDEITGGINKTAFKMLYKKYLGDIEENTYAMVLLDARKFNLVNEKFGQEWGDRFLRYCYEVIERHISPEQNEMVTRSELDHYIICLYENDPQMIQKRIDDIIAEINAVWRDSGIDHPITFRQAGYRIGAREEINCVMDKVRVAAQRQRLEDRGACLFYDNSMIEKIKRNHKLENMFESSIANRDFVMYLQPKVGFLTGRLCGAEALVRWNHPDEGMIYPSEFISLFERDGKIQKLDLYMFEEVCRYIRRRQKEGKEVFPISFNLSRNHFQNPDFLKGFVEVADKYEIPRNLLEFELTESFLLENSEIQRVKNSMQKMHELGFKCSIDDFGSGYSSLGLLREFEIDALKLDRLFFEDISTKKSRDIIKCLVELADTLNVQTVAEGIENQEQLNSLKEMPCTLIQGYVFSKPLSVTDFEKWECEFNG